MKKLRPFIFLLLAAGVIALVVTSLRREEARRAPESAYSGYAEGELIYVSSPLGGELQKLAVQRGEEVKKDTVLFELEREQERSARSEAEETSRESTSHLDKAKLDFTRAKSLRDKRVISPEDFDSSEQTLLAAQHAAAARLRGLEQADWRFVQKEQSSPATGLVYDTYFRPGEWVAAGAPVLSLLPPEYMKVRFFVPERDLGKLQIGQALAIRMDGLERPLAGKVSFVSPRAEYTLPIIYSRENREKLVYLVEGSLDENNARKLHSGAPVEVDLAVPESKP